jgi:polysaccharide chain length determinant protein (PEP-CTERM system associated)
MDDLLRLAFSYLSGIWRYRWYILLIPVVAAPIGWFYVATLPDQYSARARVFVDTDSILNELLSGLAIQSDESRRISMMTRVMFSRDNMEKLARMTDMDLRAKTNQQMDSLVSSLKRRVQLKRAGGDIYEIAFSDQSPELAKRVVQSMLTIFVESNLGSARQDQDSAEQFLQREIKDYERRMLDTDRKLKDFKMRNLDFVTEKGNYYQRLKQAKDNHKQAVEELKLVIKRKEDMDVQLKQVEQESEEVLRQQHEEWLEESTKAVTAEHDQRIQELESQIDEMLLKYTDLHPEIVALRATVARLKARREEAKQEFLATQTGEMATDFAGNPLYQQMRLRSAEGQADVATQEAKVQNLAVKIEELQRTVDHVLQVEAEQQQLERDYSAMKSNHSTLVKRLEQARLTRQVDSSADTVRFRTLDPPRTPKKPDGPNRVRMSSIVFGGSLVVGIGVAFLISMLRPVFSDRRQMNEATGIPVLGSVNMIWTKPQKRRKRVANFVFAVGFLGLIGAYVLVLTAFNMQLDLASYFAG